MNRKLFLRVNSDKKYYFIDNGLLNAIFKFSKDYGRLLENLCYLQFRREKMEIYYFKEGKECDFVLYDKEKALPVQVSCSLDDPDTHGRELKGLLHACTKLKSKKGIIITTTPKQNQKVEKVEVRYVNAMEWMLGEVAI